MSKINSYGFSLLALCSLCGLAKAESEQLEQINVNEKIVTNQQQAFKKAKATTSKEQLYKSTESVDSIVRSMPGAFTQQDKSAGVLSLNIRGESGFGRANAMVDDVVQTFYATSTDGKGRSGGTSQFGASLDPNFIAGVDLTRGSFSGKNGGNALFGSANFRTLSVNDVVRDDQKFGLLVKGLAGTNATKHNGMLTGAMKQWLDNGGYFGVLYGYSQREISQDYKVGGGTKIRYIADNFLAAKKYEFFNEQNGLALNEQGQWYDEKGWGEDPVDVERRWVEDELPQFNIQPIDPDTLRQKSRSHLAKIEYMDDHHALNLQYRTLRNAVGGRDLKNDSAQINYGLVYGNYLDLNILLARTKGVQRYAAGAPMNGKHLLADLQTKNTADTFDLSNTFTFNLPKEIELKTTLGFHWLKNKYSKNRFTEELGLFYGLSVDDSLYYRQFAGQSLMPQKSNNFQPSGEQKFKTFSLDNQLSKGIFHLDNSLNLVHYGFNGETLDYLLSSESYLQRYDENHPIFKSHCSATDDPSNPYVCDQFEPLDKQGGKRHAINHSTTLSLDIHPLFMPFVSYSKNHRMPNIQEIYFSQIGHAGVNLDLQPERAKTWQFGFNSSKNGLFSEDDFFGAKVIFYRSKINNYIHNQFGTFWNEAQKPDWVEVAQMAESIQYRNYFRNVRKKGVEIELSYDNGRFYTNLSYAYQKSNQPTNYTDPSSASNSQSPLERLDQTYGISRISTLPRDYGRLDIGTRWFDQKLTLGSAVRYYGKSKRATMEKIELNGLNLSLYKNHNQRLYVKGEEVIEKQPLIVDFYVVYEPLKDLILKAELQNAFDKKYIDPLDAGNDSANQRYYSMFDGNHSVLNNYARGRTLVFSLSYKF